MSINETLAAVGLPPTALLQYEIDTELHDLIGSVGEAHAVRSYRLGLESISPAGSLIVPKHRKEYDTRKAFGFHVE